MPAKQVAPAQARRLLDAEPLDDVLIAVDALRGGGPKEKYQQDWVASWEGPSLTSYDTHGKWWRDCRRQFVVLLKAAIALANQNPIEEQTDDNVAESQRLGVKAYNYT